LFCASNKLGNVNLIKIEFGGSLGGFVLGFVWDFFHSLKKKIELKKLCDVFTKKGNKFDKINITKFNFDQNSILSKLFGKRHHVDPPCFL
jgi:hypothetical protein